MATHFRPIEQSIGTFVIAIADIIITDTPLKKAQPTSPADYLPGRECFGVGNGAWVAAGLKNFISLVFLSGARVDLLADMSKRLTHKVGRIRSCGSQGSRCPLSACQNFYACLALFALFLGFFFSLALGFRFFFFFFFALFPGFWCCLVLALCLGPDALLFRFVKCAARVNI